jgi:hypothetical protein
MKVGDTIDLKSTNLEEFLKSTRCIFAEKYNSALKDSYYKLLNGFTSQKDIERTCGNLKSIGISDEVVDYYKELAEIRIGF